MDSSTDGRGCARDVSMRRGGRDADASDANDGHRSSEARNDALSVMTAVESAMEELERESVALDAREAAATRALARAELELETENALGARLELELAECRHVMVTMRREMAARELERALVERSSSGSATTEASAADDAAKRARRLAEIDRGFERERARTEAFRKSLEDASS